MKSRLRFRDCWPILRVRQTSDDAHASGASKSSAGTPSSRSSQECSRNMPDASRPIGNVSTPRRSA